MSLVSFYIKGFGEAAFQHGVVALEKSVPKQRYQVGGAVHHATGLRYGSRPVIRL